MNFQLLKAQVSSSPAVNQQLIIFYHTFGKKTPVIFLTGAFANLILRNDLERQIPALPGLKGDLRVEQRTITLDYPLQLQAGPGFGVVNHLCFDPQLILDLAARKPLEVKKEDKIFNG